MTRPGKVDQFSGFGSILGGALVAEDRVRVPGVVDVERGFDLPWRMCELLEAMEPDALPSEAVEETLADAVLLRRVRRDVLLAELVVLAGGAEAAGLEDQPVVRAHRWCGSSSA